MISVPCSDPKASPPKLGPRLLLVWKGLGTKCADPWDHGWDGQRIWLKSLTHGQTRSLYSMFITCERSTMQSYRYCMIQILFGIKQLEGNLLKCWWWYFVCGIMSNIFYIYISMAFIFNMMDNILYPFQILKSGYVLLLESGKKM